MGNQGSNSKGNKEKWDDKIRERRIIKVNQNVIL